MKHFFYLPIGDFSCDGHGSCDNILAVADKPVETVRDAHFCIELVTGIDLSGFCDSFGDASLPEDVETRLRSLGISIPQKEDGCCLYLSPELMAAIWVDLLNFVNNELHVRLVQEDDYPCLLVSGKDERGRTCRNVGYGLVMG